MSGQQGVMAEQNNNNQVTDNEAEMTGERTVFDTLLSVSLDTFADSFVAELIAIYEYDATEIKDFLIMFNRPHDSLKFVALAALRQLLLENLRSKFPALSSKQLFSRRKTETIANDIYILGYSVVNEMEDSRLNKILKNPDEASVASAVDPNDLETSQYTVVDTTAELIETCLDLKRAVKSLTKTVNDLQDDIKSLNRRLQLQQGPPHQSVAPSHTLMRQVPMQQPQVDEDAEETAPAPPSTDVEGLDERRNLEIGTSNETVLHNPATGRNIDEVRNSLQQIESEQFTLPRNQRQRARNGKAFSGSEREEILGSATRPLSIEGIVSSGNTAPKSVYVGRLSGKTTPSSVRTHLREVGVTQICDIIDLKCKSPDQTSFCIIVDDLRAEEAMYDPNIWPRGAKIRPFRERANSSHNRNRHNRHNRQHQVNNKGPRFRPQRNNGNSSQQGGSTNPSPKPSVATPVLASDHPQLVANAQPSSGVSSHPWFTLVQRPPYSCHSTYADPMSQNRFSPLMWHPGMCV